MKPHCNGIIDLTIILSIIQLSVEILYKVPRLFSIAGPSNQSWIGLGDTEKRAPQYIVKVFITIIDIITILHVNHKTCYIDFILLFSFHKMLLNYRQWMYRNM